MTEIIIRLMGLEPDGKVYVSNWFWALLFGVDLAEVERFMATVDFEAEGVDCLPAEWHRAGFRRGHEAMAHTGSDAPAAVIDYWARKEHGWALVFPAAGEIWLVDAAGGAR